MAIDVGSMFDADDHDEIVLGLDAVDDAIRASPRRPVALELSLQRLPDTRGVIQQRTQHELHDRRGDALR